MNEGSKSVVDNVINAARIFYSCGNKQMDRITWLRSDMRRKNGTWVLAGLILLCGIIKLCVGGNDAQFKASYEKYSNLLESMSVTMTRVQAQLKNDEETIALAEGDLKKANDELKKLEQKLIDKREAFQKLQAETDEQIRREIFPQFNAWEFDSLRKI